MEHLQLSAVPFRLQSRAEASCCTQYFFHILAAAESTALRMTDMFKKISLPRVWYELFTVLFIPLLTGPESCSRKSSWSQDVPI